MITLDTMESGLAACAQQWASLLSSPVEVPADDATRFFGLFRALLLEPERDVAEAAEMFLAEGWNPDAVRERLHYLTELSSASDEPADRARRCHQVIARRMSP
ncbi:MULTISPECIES: hypothetical protein [Streptomyces violaceusniger group]|uniref:Uncharacterized protein n=2 Tax=Streptomyces javensis TaxID=114698 RepID=A0ABS0RIM6_9ACTN|nr:hypothetical protein [Streptomyces javensis]MBI0317145.1 hypothetical protein [Streptomyces javensis]